MPADVQVFGVADPSLGYRVALRVGSWLSLGTLVGVLALARPTRGQRNAGATTLALAGGVAAVAGIWLQVGRIGGTYWDGLTIDSHGTAVVLLVFGAAATVFLAFAWP